MLFRSYRDHLALVREFVDGLENFQTIGRNGLHRYNNQDHAMLTGMLAVRNLLNGENNDLWVVNAEQEYHEEIREEREPELPFDVDEIFARAFMRLDPIALGTAVGIVSGMILFGFTLFVLLNQLSPIARYFWLLGQYFPGYTVTGVGSVFGLIYGFLVGFGVGWGIAFLRNSMVRLYVSILRRRAEIDVIEKYGFFPDVQSRSALDDMDDKS